jgi:hypothetical protein
MADTPKDPTPPVDPVAADGGGLWGWYNTMPRALRHTLTGTTAVVASMLVAWLAGIFDVNVKDLKREAKEAAKEAAREAAKEEVQKEKLEVMQSDTPPPALTFGWYGEPETVAVARGQVPVVFRNTPAGGNDDLPESVYQWKVHERVTGKKTPEKDQGNVGSCVSQGETTAYERALVCAIAAGEPFTFTEFAEEAIYAVSRVDIGNGQLRGQDGSVGGWAARGATEVGNLPAAKYAEGDFTAYSASRAKQLGDRGVSAAIKAEMGKYKAGSAANLKTTLDLKKALASGAGTYVCTQLGFAAQRDANGACRQQGRWGHCMACDGYTTVGGRVYFHLDNSWDHVYHTGPVGPGEPTGTGFYVPENVMAQILSEGDSWALSAVKGFPKLKNLDWFIDARPARPDRRANPLLLALAF